MVDVRVRRTLEEVADVLEALGASYEPSVEVHTEGRVTQNADEVLRVAGLFDAGMDERLVVGEHLPAMVLGLKPGVIEVAALDGAADVEEGERVRATGEPIGLPVGDELLGRVVDPIGRPLDGLPMGDRLTWTPIHRPARPIFERGPVHTPLFTGALMVDAMFPVGRGQRELILGDEGTGKTSLALDALLRQRETGVVGVYVAIGRRRAETWRVVQTLREGGGRWVVVAAPEDTSAGLRYLAPYAGASIAEHFADRGEHALVVYDELSAHAVAWRELSLILRRPPGREAYPGDIFYIHSRLLERATQLSVEQGGGSVTALPIASLESGRLSAFIPTNLISITDGQLVLSTPLFVGGQRPAIDAGLSVSRIGSRAQPQALRAMAGRLKLDYAGFLELEVFSRLGTRLEPKVERRLAIGRRVRALLRGGRLAPLDLFGEVVRLVLATETASLLAVPEREVQALSQALDAQVRDRDGALVRRVADSQVLGESDRASLASLIAREVEVRYGGEEGAP